MSYAAEIDADNAALWFRFQEASGAPQDSSGNGNHMIGAISGAAYQQASPITTDASDYSTNIAAGQYVPDDAATLHVGDESDATVISAVSA